MDLRRELENALGARGARAAFVVCGIGSLREARLRLAGATEASSLAGPLEILTLAGSIAADGSHLHVSVADGAGNVSGGHAGYGCVVRTTAEVLVVFLPEWSFSREPDPQTGHAELVIRSESPPR